MQIENRMVIGDYYPSERAEPDPDRAYEKSAQEKIDNTVFGADDDPDTPGTAQPDEL